MGVCSAFLNVKEFQQVFKWGPEKHTQIIEVYLDYNEIKDLLDLKTEENLAYLQPISASN